MGKPRKVAGTMWAFQPAHRLSKLDKVLVEDQRTSPCCANGVTNRVAEREFHEPWRWIVIGYRCNRCGQMWIETSVTV